MGGEIKTQEDIQPACLNLFLSVYASNNQRSQENGSNLREGGHGCCIDKVRNGIREKAAGPVSGCPMSGNSRCGLPITRHETHPGRIQDPDGHRIPKWHNTEPRAREQDSGAYGGTREDTDSGGIQNPVNTLHSGVRVCESGRDMTVQEPKCGHAQDSGRHGPHRW